MQTKLKFSTNINARHQPIKMSIKRYISSCLIFSEQELDEIENAFEKKIVPKKTMLLTAGKVCNLEGFIIKGCVKTYFIDKNGDEVILTIATENWWICDIISFEEQTESNMYIETIEDCELLILSPKSKMELIKKYPQLEKLFRLIVQRHLRTYQERLYGTNALTAEERYTDFLEKYPALPQRIPQLLIASYLGISAEFLSRIRGRKIKK